MICIQECKQFLYCHTFFSLSALLQVTPAPSYIDFLQQLQVAIILNIFPNVNLHCILCCDTFVYYVTNNFITTFNNEFILAQA